MALSLLVTIPFQALVSLVIVRRHVRMTWMEFALSLWKSAAVTICTSVSPAIVAVACYPSDIDMASAIVAATLSAMGWGLAVWFFEHPVLAELSHVTMFMKRAARRPRQPRPNLLTVADGGQTAILPGETK